MIARTLSCRLALWTLAAPPVRLATALGNLYVGLARLPEPALERRARRSLALAGIDARSVVRTGPAHITGAAVVPLLVLWPESEQRYIGRLQEQIAMSCRFAGANAK